MFSGEAAWPTEAETVTQNKQAGNLVLSPLLQTR